MKPLRTAVLLALVALAAAGCSKLRDAAFRQKTANDFKLLCELYGAYYAARGHGPTGVDDLEPLAVGDERAEAVLQAVRGGRYVLLWGVDVHAVGRTRPGMAFTVVLFTNIFVVIASVRSRRRRVTTLPVEAAAPILTVSAETEPLQ